MRQKNNNLKARNILSTGVPIQGQETHIQFFVTSKFKRTSELKSPKVNFS